MSPSKFCKREFLTHDIAKLTNGNVVVIVNHDKVAELQVTRSAGSLAGNTFHGTSITEETVCVVVDDIVARLVEDSGSVSLSNG